MKNVITRLLMFAVGVPGLIGAVLLLPNHFHLPFNLLVVLVAGISARELAEILAARPNSYRLRASAAMALGMALPAATLTALFAGESLIVVPASLTALAAVLLGFQGFRRQEPGFKRIIPAVGTSFFLLIYPGLFASYIVMLSTLPFSTVIILLFLATVYLNDSLAYVIGMLFGTRNQQLVPISPNKSLEGFVGGFVTSILAVVVAGYFFPQVLPGSVWRRVVLGAAVGGAAMIGDLAESALKRSALVKDSGELIPGRGGLLDSVDSPVFSAFVFYYLYTMLFLTQANI